METFLLCNRWLHIAAGFTGFFVAPVALVVRKGRAAHRLWGRVFFWAMVLAGTTALAAASLKGLSFLLLTGIFSLYLAQFGYRSLQHKGMGQGRAPGLYDWASALAGLAVFGGTLGYGLLNRPFNLVLVVFGSIGVFITVRQLQGFRRPGGWPAGQWLRNHISGFMGAYIAAVSAFSATSLTFIAFPLNFLWPTLIFVPLLLWLQRHYVPKTGVSPRVLTR
ncbi:hypothetical protein KLP40_15630 [Hymenobacter sp. NST-14]|uniref:hypothetical protein n=1 Tax=Hymenobacter piscis TaxID=2839984 RepID=UPI001C01096C|nr:hypothetical protein [Hymenobacter piscis]MBT9394602.1 hypothetical protein [Hymenobacter piscis]